MNRQWLKLIRSPGAASLVVAIIAVISPLLTLYLIWISLVLAAIASYRDQILLPGGALLVCIINLVLFSPITLLSTGTHLFRLGVTLCLFALCIGLWRRALKKG